MHKQELLVVNEQKQPNEKWKKPGRRRKAREQNQRSWRKAKSGGVLGRKKKKLLLSGMAAALSVASVVWDPESRNQVMAWG